LYKNINYSSFRANKYIIPAIPRPINVPIARLPPNPSFISGYLNRVSFIFFQFELYYE